MVWSEWQIYINEPSGQQELMLFIWAPKLVYRSAQIQAIVTEKIIPNV